MAEPSGPATAAGMDGGRATGPESGAERLRRALGDALDALPEPGARVVLAVSGGADSMALLRAAARWVPERVAMVATFDHGTGAAAREAAALVVAEARRLGLSVVRERDRAPASTEAGWRAARWAFLRRVARGCGARVATAHTRDDQVETVLQRALRGAGPRGLAGLAATGPVVRPWLSIPRAEVRAWLAASGGSWVSDPANADRRHQRARLRLDLLPALEATAPGFAAALVTLGERAAVWRAEAESLARSLPFQPHGPGVWRVPRAVTAGWTAPMLAVVWPVWCADGGVVLDGDGTRRLLRFILGEARAGELRLPGGGTLVRLGDDYELRSATVSATIARARAAGVEGGQPEAGLQWPGWRFTALAGPPADRGSPWVAAFERDTTLAVRGWQPGDRLAGGPAGAGRRLVRYLVEAGIPRLDRPAWPVVLAGGEVAWAPGVCRGPSAPPRSGRSDLIWYRSEREFG
jgi:tRNA(Ile)-lysidine synthase